ncbi:phage terminase small subunit [Corynebacterium cystitidis]|uniref:phage terminase small subunit n=1 Tax=Corynebacterium cystitidis TaxID=35757 RepID=UPI00211ECAF6|nr:hypothetical protein [Corynebacterium cystitidis]
MPGPPPKRSDQRRRRNKPADGQTVSKAVGASRVKAPNVKPKWHPLMKDWYRSLKESGQSQFYQPSDWRTAQLICHIMSEALNGEEPIKASLLAQFNSVATDLMTTEGARRRLRLELQNPDVVGGDDGAATVSIMEMYRDKLS